MRTILALFFLLVANATALAQCAVVSPTGGNDLAVIQGAFASNLCVTLKAENYQLCGRLDVPVNGSFLGQGMGTRITKTCNGDMVVLRTSATMRGMNLVGNSPTFSGGAIVIEGDSYQVLENVAGYSQDAPLQFRVNDGGGNIYVRGFSFVTWPTLTQFSVTLPMLDSTGGGNRTFRDGKFNGGWGFDLSGANNTILDNINQAGVRMTSDTRSVSFLRNRIGGGGPTGNIELHGSNHYWAGNLPSAPLVCNADVVNTDVWEFQTPITNLAGGGCRVHP